MNSSMNLNELDEQLKQDIQPDQDIQPEEGIHYPDYEHQSRTQSDKGAARASQNNDDITEAPEEA